jgi:hypothetical protein
MKKVKIIAGICWAFFALILIIILFPGLNSFSVSVSKLPFMKINPRYTGGEVVSHMIAESCTLDIRKPVFNGLFKDRESGFIQLDWRGKIPWKIIDTLDYDNDGNLDFCIFVDTKNSETSIVPLNIIVKNVVLSTPTSYGWSVRVGLLKDKT